MPDFDVFLSFTWSDVDAVEPIEKALRDNGLRVFRDSECITEFDGITEELVTGLASAKVLLAYYSKRYPTRPQRCAAAVITGVGGIGKTSLAEQYALVFRDAFPAGVHWVGPLGADGSLTWDAADVVAQFHQELAELARTDLGLRVDGVEFARLRVLVAERLRRPALLV